MIKTAFIKVDGESCDNDLVKEIDEAIAEHPYTKRDRGKVISVSYCNPWMCLVAWEVHKANCAY